MGKSAAARVQKRQKLLKDLKTSTRFDGERWYGQCSPATIINLNPVALVLAGGLERWSVPIAGEGKNPPVKLKYKGREFKGSYMTLTEPHIYDVMTGFEESGTDVFVQSEAAYLPPVGLAHQFYSHYVLGHRDPMTAADLLQHQQRRVPLRRPVGLIHSGVHNQALAVFHQQIPAVTQLRFFARAFARQLGIGSVFDSCVSLLRF